MDVWKNRYVVTKNLKNRKEQILRRYATLGF